MTPRARRTLKVISYLGLVLSALPAFLVFGGLVSKETYLQLMVLGMVLWFGTAGLWIQRDHLGD